MKEIYIFDIDGCIMPPIISNFNDNNKSREKIVNEIVDNGSKIKLFTEFIRYYEKFCKQAESVIFITGRKESEFGKLTETQLKPLENIKMYQIIYYPETRPHKSNVYFEWKVKMVQDIINTNIYRKEFDEDYKKDIFFNIFDDMTDYFTKIKKFSNKYGLQINLFLINGEKSWLELKLKRSLKKTGFKISNL